MVTLDYRIRDVEADPEASLWLKSYTSVPQINRLIRLIRPFKFKTLHALAPKSLKGPLLDLIDYFNGSSNPIPEDDPRSILLWEKNIPLYDGGKKPYVVPYLLEGKRAPLVIAVPGGSYTNVAMPHEGIAIAEKMNSLGFHALVLNYRVSPSRYPCMQIDMIRAVQLARSNAEKWGVIEDEIIIMGFSAGGHLVMSVPALYEELKDMTGDLKDVDGLANAIVGGYPMIDLKCKALGITCDMIFLGKDYSEERSRELCVQNLINSSYPPTFLFAMEGDGLVPPAENCIVADKMLEECGVKHEMHVYPGDAHGFGLGEGTSAEGWVDSAVDFLRRSGVIDKAKV